MGDELSFKEKIIAIIGLLFQGLSIISFAPVNVFGIYLISKYYHYYIDKGEEPISMYYSYFITSTFTVCLAIGVVISGISEHKIGYRLTILISTIIGTFASICVYWINSFFLAFCSFGLYGLSSGLSQMISSKQLCSFFPDKKGLLIGIFFALGGLAGSGFTFLGEYMINPSNEEMDPITHAYSKIISNNYNKYTLVTLIILPAGALIFFVITSRINFELSNNENPKVNNEAPELNRISSKIIENTPELDTPLREEEEIKKKFQTPNPKNYWKNLGKIFSSWDYWGIILIILTQGFFIGMLSCTYRPVGDMMEINRTVMNYTSTFSNLSLLIFVPIWGFLLDKFGFRLLSFFISISSTINSALFIVTIYTKSSALFSICVTLNVINTGGSNVIYLPFTMKKFGMYYSMEVSGCLNIMSGLFSLFCCFLEFLIVVLYKTKSNTPFYISYGIGTGLSVISVIFIYLINENKFKFGDDEEIDEKVNLVDPILKNEDNIN